MNKGKRSLAIFLVILIALVLINIKFIIEFIQERGWVAILIIFVIIPAWYLLYKWLKNDNII